MSQMSEPPQESIAQHRALLASRVPRSVTAVAAERQLGELWNARIVADLATMARMAALVGVPSLILAAIGLTRTGFLGVVGLLGAIGVVIALIIAAYAVKTWMAGADDWYLYTNGIVAAQRRRLQAVTWPEVASLQRKRMGLRVRSRGMLGMTPDTLRGYQVSLRDGTGVFLTVSDHLEEGKRFVHQVEELAAGARVPVSG